MTIIIIIVIIFITQKEPLVKTLRMTNKLVDFLFSMYDIIAGASVVGEIYLICCREGNGR